MTRPARIARIHRFALRAHVFNVYRRYVLCVLKPTLTCKNFGEWAS